MTTRRSYPQQLVLTLALGCILGLLPACAPDDMPDDEALTPEEAPRAVDRVLAAQAAAGAHQDATLYPMHFDGAQLNPLGLAKLRLMARAPATQPMVVYLDAPERDPLNAQRRDAIAAGFRELGRADAQVEVRLGANPAALSSAATGVKSLERTDSAAERSDPTVTAGSGSGSGSSGGSSAYGTTGGTSGGR